MTPITRTNRRAVRAGTLAVASTALLLGAAVAAGPASAAPTSGDAAFVTANEQVNLAEITIGTIAESKGQDSGTKDLATKTISDHQTAKAKLTAIATTLGAPLPAAPNAVQQSQAAQLKAASASSFDLMYAQIQVAGHKQAIAAAQAEAASGSDAQLRAYASYYVGVATMHLQMAEAEVAALGGSSTAVPAGSGGGAATTTGSALPWELGGAAGVLVAVLGGLLLMRRRTTA